MSLTSIQPRSFVPDSTGAERMECFANTCNEDEPKLADRNDNKHN